MYCSVFTDGSFVPLSNSVGGRHVKFFEMNLCATTLDLAFLLRTFSTAVRCCTSLFISYKNTVLINSPFVDA